METAVAGTSQNRSVNDSVLAISWWVLIGAASGAIAGFLVGGIGGRLAMLLLRLTSPDSVIGVTSDDGFEIGVFTFSTFNLLFAMTMLGGFVGVLYAAVRTAIPARLRLPLWTTFWALVGGAAVVHDDGVDFQALEPALLAIVLFVVLPAIGAALIVLLVERWSRTSPWQSRRFAACMVLAALASTFALMFALAVTVVALALERAGPVGTFVHQAARIVVPVAIVVFSVMAGLDLARDSGRILE